MGLLSHRPRIKKTCDFCNTSAFGLMRRHTGGKTFCSPHCEASFTNCRMIDDRPYHIPPRSGRRLHRRAQLPVGTNPCRILLRSGKPTAPACNGRRAFPEGASVRGFDGAK